MITDKAREIIITSLQSEFIQKIIADPDFYFDVERLTNNLVKLKLLS
jgi:hypothetical protein